MILSTNQRLASTIASQWTPATTCWKTGTARKRLLREWFVRFPTRVCICQYWVQSNTNNHISHNKFLNFYYYAYLATGSPKREGFIIKYLERTLELNGYVYPEILFSRGLSDLESCATHCQTEIKCKAVVWTSNKVCYAYERLISTTEIRIPYPNAMLFNMN